MSYLKLFFPSPVVYQLRVKFGLEVIYLSGAGETKHGASRASAGLQLKIQTAGYEMTDVGLKKERWQK